MTAISTDNVVNLQKYRESLKYEDQEDEFLYQCGVEGEDINADIKFISDEIWKLFYIYTDEQKLPDSYFVLVELLFLSILELENPKHKDLKILNRIKKMMKVDDMRKEMEV
jgi:hypothetical protein